MKIHHVLSTQKFADILKNGGQRKGKTLSLYIKRENRGKELFVGVTVAKRFAPLAVTRNYIKRLVYAYFLENKEHITQGSEIVVRITKDVRNFNKKEISRTIREELSRAIGS